MKDKKLVGNTLLIIAALVWGYAYIPQSVGMDYVNPFTFNGIRCILAGIALIPACIVFDILKKKKGTYVKPTKEESKILITGGISCGIILFISSTLQQYGIANTTVGKAGFIAVLYILIVPFVEFFMKKPLPKNIWLCLAIALIGLYLLCVNENFTFQKGDFFVFLGAIGYSFHIITIDRFSPKTDGTKLSCIQFITAGLISSIFILIVDKPTLSAIMMARLPIIYAGIVSGGVGYTLQIIGQKWTDSTVASLLLSLESVFAILSGALFLFQIPTLRETIGCILMFIAIIIIQLTSKEKEI